MTSRDELAYEETLAYQRSLWRYCAETVAARWCYRQHGPQTTPCLTEQEILKSLLSSIDDVPALDVLIRKTEPDIPSFEESRMSLAERYRF